MGNKMANKAQQDTALVKIALDRLKDPPPIIDLSTISGTDENIKKEKVIFLYKCNKHFSTNWKSPPFVHTTTTIKN